METHVLVRSTPCRYMTAKQNLLSNHILYVLQIAVYPNNIAK